MVDGLKVLHLLSYHQYTGAAEPVLRLARAQIEAGHSCSIAFDRHRPGDVADRAREFGVPVVDGPLLSVKAPPWTIPRDVAWLRRAVGEYDIVHCHRSHDHVLAVAARALVGGEGRAAVVRTFHSGKSLRRSRRWLYSRTDGFVATCRRDERRLLEMKLCGSGRVVRIEGALDLDRWKRGQDRLRQELGIRADVPVAGIVARMKKGRGHELLIAAWRRVLEILPDAVLLLVGRGELRHRLEKKVESMGLSRSVVFCGYRQDLENVYPAFDLKVMLAPGNDGTCRAALEAMACGVPLAAAPVGALEDIVEEGKTGWLLRAKVPEELGEHLAGLLRDREALKSAGQNARRVAVERFTIERQLERVLALYERCLAQNTRDG